MSLIPVHNEPEKMVFAISDHDLAIHDLLS
jgi:hypothetical protein